MSLWKAQRLSNESGKTLSDAHHCFTLLICELKRILSPSNFVNGADPSVTNDLFADAYPAAYQTLYDAKPITCSVSSTTFDAVPAPCAVILDVSLPMYHDIKTNSP